MKTEFSKYPGKALEIANRALYSLKVLVIGLFIPFCFVFGITFDRHDESAAKSVEIIKTNSVTQNNNTIHLIKIANDKNS